jgi:glutamine---fructose-6-phosphate transaminase (isomerizing)
VTFLKPSKPPSRQLHGAYAIAVFHKDEPQRVIGARAQVRHLFWAWARASTFLASDAMALAGVTDQIVYLEEGDRGRHPDWANTGWWTSK